MQINEQLKLPINGVLQYVSIRAEEAGLPLLLYLHGGPGDAALPLVLKYNRELESHFTVAVWDRLAGDGLRGLHHEHRTDRRRRPRGAADHRRGLARDKHYQDVKAQRPRQEDGGLRDDRRNKRHLLR